MTFKEKEAISMDTITSNHNIFFPQAHLPKVLIIKIISYLPIDCLKIVSLINKSFCSLVNEDRQKFSNTLQIILSPKKRGAVEKLIPFDRSNLCKKTIFSSMEIGNHRVFVSDERNCISILGENALLFISDKNRLPFHFKKDAHPISLNINNNSTCILLKNGEVLELGDKNEIVTRRKINNFSPCDEGKIIYNDQSALFIHTKDSTEELNYLFYSVKGDDNFETLQCCSFFCIDNKICYHDGGDEISLKIKPIELNAGTSILSESPSHISAITYTEDHCFASITQENFIHSNTLYVSFHSPENGELITEQLYEFNETPGGITHSLCSFQTFKDWPGKFIVYNKLGTICIIDANLLKKNSDGSYWECETGFIFSRVIPFNYENKPYLALLGTDQKSLKFINVKENRLIERLTLNCEFFFDVNFFKNNGIFQLVTLQKNPEDPMTAELCTYTPELCSLPKPTFVEEVSSIEQEELLKKLFCNEQLHDFSADPYASPKRTLSPPLPNTPEKKRKK
ncbi:MAG: hypothetical protein JSR80_03605 [Verrucomicrobia bacterium]|nr:hypothetical protein [Verrucomicrobiota bacterium]